MLTTVLRMFGMLGLVLSGLLITAHAAEADKDLKKFEGEYVMVSGEKSGEKLPEETLKSAKLTMKGDKHTVHVGDDTIIGTHKLDSSKTPKHIDSMDTEGPFKGKTTLGIYKFENGEYTVCFAAPGKDRPREFATKSGSDEFLHVWKKK